MEETADYNFSFSVHEEILEIVFTGEVTKNTVDRLHVEVMALIQGENPRAVLSDVRALKGHEDAFSAVYYRVRSIPPDVQRLPCAVVSPLTNTAYRTFYETTSANAGMLVKWFTEIEAARAWLKSMI
ncbi:MAG TPA: STAS/SEC14 domain-containing protein [Deltaproteobacteria bacterium]|nr:STAS/SEC14 domain-containing protein [Deltaproteobacteria bacterium]HPR55609.1 STAS/SEC14 domain-containing protein [Deltaproteobacteria bacterium]HXK48301.1 STAS/SEC14 domain-containing protein [Deltaproteobacteria bacterium]